MKKNNYALLLSLCFITSVVYGHSIHILCTAALIPNDYEKRKQQYIKNVQTLKKYGCDPYIVESLKTDPTFLDEYYSPGHVCYTQSNDAACRNKGVNEARSLSIGIHHFGFEPDDMIIKFTGRYHLATNEFIRLVEDNPDADVIARVWHDNDGYTALFAMRTKYLLDFLDNYLNYSEMQRKHICIEHLFAPYIRKLEKAGKKVIYIPRIYDYLPVSSGSPGR